MPGLMQDAPLILSVALERAERLFAGREVVTATAGGFRRRSHGAIAGRARRLAAALRARGLRPGDRVATLGWNSDDHFEACLAVPCLGLVLVPLNPRLPPAALAAMLAHAQARLCLVDAVLLPLWAEIGAALPAIVMAADGTLPDGAEAYDELLQAPSLPHWPRLAEGSAAALCYTSGTTGGPKGVLYSHRALLLHALACLFADGIALRARDICLPVVPLFHAIAWGFPYAALLAGAGLAFPGPRTDPQALAALIAESGATLATGVPTVWQRLLSAIAAGEVAADRLASLERLPVGGAAVTEPLLRGYAGLGVEVIHCWGMTELSPIGTVSAPRDDLPPDRRAALRLRQGLPLPGISLRLLGADGEELPWDGRSAGELQVHGPWVADAYHDPDAPDGRGGGERFATDGQGRRWLRTGDIASIEPEGYLRLVDREKDLVKSGGEWISSLELEAILLDCEGVEEAAVIAAPDPVWGERPLACIAGPAAPAAAALRQVLAERLPRWQVPERFAVLPELPKNATGKIDKKRLREMLAAGILDSAAAGGA